MNQSHRAVLGLNAGLLIMSLAPIFAKIIPWPATVIVCGRMLLGAPLLWLFLVLRKQAVQLQQTREYMLLAGLSALLALHWITYFAAAKVATVAVASVSLFTYPITTALIEPFVFHERLRWKDLSLAILACLGIVIMIEEFSFQSGTFQGVLFGLVSGTAFAFRNIASRRLAQRYSGSQIMLYQLAFGGLLLSPALLFLEFTITQATLIQLFGLALFATAIAHSIFVWSLRHLTARAAGTISTIQPLHIAIYGIIFLDEIPSLRVLIGGALVLSAVLIETRRQSLPVAPHPRIADHDH